MANKSKKLKQLIEGSSFSQFLDNLSHKYLGMPSAATMEEWEEWENDCFKNHPIITFFLIKTRRKIRSEIYSITQTFYHLKSKYITKNHYIRIDVKRFMGSDLMNYIWYDSDVKILYSNFQILVDFVEGENPAGHIDWNATPEHSQAWQEIQTLYNWWIVDRPKRDEEFPFPNTEDYGITSKTAILFNNHNSDEEAAIKRWQKAVDEYHKKEYEWDTEDTEMLIRLITIRKWLWT